MGQVTVDIFLLSALVLATTNTGDTAGNGEWFMLSITKGVQTKFSSTNRSNRYLSHTLSVSYSCVVFSCSNILYIYVQGYWPQRVLYIIHRLAAHKFPLTAYVFN